MIVFPSSFPIDGKANVLLVFQSGNNDYNFSFRLFLGKMSRQLRHRTPDSLLVQLGQFARDRSPAFRSQIFGKLLQSFHQPERRFIKDHRTRLQCQLLQFGLPSLLLGQKSLEAEAIVRQPRID